MREAVVMSPPVRRVRGALLRIVRRRARCVAMGVLLVAPAAWVQFGGVPVPWWAEGLSLISGATGAALLWTGIVGLGPDWVDRA
jgi:hypothetical protein